MSCRASVVGWSCVALNIKYQRRAPIHVRDRYNCNWGRTVKSCLESILSYWLQDRPFAVISSVLVNIFAETIEVSTYLDALLILQQYTLINLLLFPLKDTTSGSNIPFNCWYLDSCIQTCLHFTICSATSFCIL